jgi:F0F1-type ATP synthase assembly protein I
VDFRFRYDRHRRPPEYKVDTQRREQDTQLRMRGLAIGLTIPTALAGGPLGGWLLGSWIDRLAGTHIWMPILTIGGTLAGLASVLEMLIKLGRQR